MTQAQAAEPEFSAIRAVGEAIRWTIGRPLALIRRIWLFLIVFGLLLFALSFLPLHPIITAPVGEALLLGATALVAVRMHRAYLLGEDAVLTGWRIYLPFILYLLLFQLLPLLFLTFGFSVPLALITDWLGAEAVLGGAIFLLIPIGIAAGIAYGIVLCRLVIVFPSIAIGRPGRPGWAWRTSRTFGLSIFGGAILIVLTLFAINIVVVSPAIAIFAGFAADTAAQTQSGQISPENTDKISEGFAFLMDRYRLGLLLVQLIQVLLHFLAVAMCAVYASSIFRQLEDLRARADSAVPIAMHPNGA